MTGNMQVGQFVGAVQAKRIVNGLLLAEAQYGARLVVAPHVHDHALCALVLDGGFLEERGSRASAVEAGSMIFQPPHEVHSHRFPTGARLFNVQFGSPWIGRMEAHGIRVPVDPDRLQNSRATWLASQLHRESGAPDQAAELVIEGLAVALLGELARSTHRTERGGPPPWLARSVDLLHSRMRESVNMADIADAVGVHPTHLARTFRQHYGCSMGEYLRRLRVDLARQELVTTTKPLSSIAYAAGFSDQAHFSRVFKSLTGLTPGAYRKTAVR